MNETQALLTAYVEAKAREVIRRKEETDREPPVATLREILGSVQTDAIESMRALCRNGVFSPTRTLNYPALMRKK